MGHFFGTSKKDNKVSFIKLFILLLTQGLTVAAFAAAPGSGFSTATSGSAVDPLANASVCAITLEQANEQAGHVATATLVAAGMEQAKPKKDQVTLYKPVGHVSSQLIETFGQKHPLLFTPVYFEMLANALYKEGMSGIVNNKGEFHSKQDAKEIQRALSLAEGKGKATVQMQGRVATAIWEQMVKVFHLEDPNYDESRINLYATAAQYENIDSFRATRDYLLDNMTQRRQIIEFMRLSLPFGIRMGIDQVGRNNTRALFITSGATLLTGFITYIITHAMALAGNPDVGFFAGTLIPLGAASIGGIRAYIYNAPKNNWLKNLHLKWMNYQNRKTLKAKNFISDDGEATGFINAEFTQIEDLESSIDEAQIRAIQPEFPTTINDQDVSQAMAQYGYRIGVLQAAVTEFQNQLSAAWRAKTQQMGEPFLAMARFLKSNMESNEPLPANMHQAISEHQVQIFSVLEKIAHTSQMLGLLRKQFEFHIRKLKEYETTNKARLSTAAKNRVSSVITTLQNGLIINQTLRDVTDRLSSNLSEVSDSLRKALQGISQASALKSLSQTQRAEFAEAIVKLLNVYNSADTENVDRTEIEGNDEPQ